MNVPGNGQIPDPDSAEALGGEDAAVAEGEVASPPTSIAIAAEAFMNNARCFSSEYQGWAIVEAPCRRRR